MYTYIFKQVDSKIINKIKIYYYKYKIQQNDLNKINVYKKNNITITIYKTNTILFQGKNCEIETKLFFKNLYYKNNYNVNIIGNDEVGVGDIFGPLVVTCCYIDSQNIDQLKKLSINDSKKMSDHKIITLTPKIKKLVKYQTEIINNNIYNKLYNKYKNSHIIKAIAHNNVLTKLLKYKNIKYYKAIIIDQFVNEKKYYEYLKNEKIIKHKVIFMTKAENKSLAVVCSSIISRYIFLQEIKKLENKYQIILPLGANNKVKCLANKYKLQFSKNEYCNFIKLHFNLQIK